MKSKQFVEIIRTVIREEIENAIPQISSQILEHLSSSGTESTINERPMQPGETAFAASRDEIRRILQNNVQWSEPLDEKGYTQPAPQRGAILPESLPGESGARPFSPKPGNAAQEKVLAAMNRDYSGMFKK
ncbi:MAG: hypothetical protein VW683_00325 [Betaproteobacteria bacterium]|jgi:hypothetical protein